MNRTTLDSDARALSLVSRSRAWNLTAFTTLALALTLVDRQALAALAGTVTSSLGISDFGYGWLSSAFAAAYLVGSLPSAQLIQRIGPRFGLVLTLSLTSLVIGLHAIVPGYTTLLLLRIALGVAVAPSFACATQTVHRVLPFKDRSRAIGLLYLGNSLGSSICPPLAVLLASFYGWRGAFVVIAILGFLLVPVWVALAFAGRERPLFDASSIGLTNPFQNKPDSLRVLARDPRVFRGSLVVAAAAPITTVMLLWGTKYLIRDHAVAQEDVGKYLWLPALLFGLGSVLFGELRARSSRTRASLRPPRTLVAIAACLSTSMAAVPLADGPWACILIASLAMAGAGGLYSLATSDMLAHAPRGTIPATAGFTTLTQSLVYIVVNPIIGKVVECTGSFSWILIGAGLAVVPGVGYWLFNTSMARPTLPPEPREPWRY